MIIAFEYSFSEFFSFLICPVPIRFHSFFLHYSEPSPLVIHWNSNHPRHESNALQSELQALEDTRLTAFPLEARLVRRAKSARGEGEQEGVGNCKGIPGKENLYEPVSMIPFALMYERELRQA